MRTKRSETWQGGGKEGEDWEASRLPESKWEVRATGQSRRQTGLQEGGAVKIRVGGMRLERKRLSHQLWGRSKAALDVRLRHQCVLCRPKLGRRTFQWMSIRSSGKMIHLAEKGTLSKLQKYWEWCVSRFYSAWQILFFFLEERYMQYHLNYS